VSFVTYQGASVIFLRVFDWKRSRISVRRSCGAPELHAVGQDGFKYHLINEDLSNSECDVSGFRFISFNSPIYEPILYC
jgi:hypothetical protein